jgi:nucleoside-diphosphate-sugar epimerase
MKILVTGGCGYIGSVLIPKLIKNKHKIICVDNQWFGNFLPKHPNLKNLKMDIRNIDQLSLKGVDTIIHLASIANDPMADLDKNLSWETSALSTFKLMNQAIKYKVRRILYASSGSVYGIKHELKVHEDLKLEPISLYNKVKMITERVILSYGDSIEKFIIRPATVCGFSPRMRYDVTVNALSFSAIKKKVITVFGGKQVRPNIHIDDMVDLYIYLIKSHKKHQGIYNAGFENESIINIAKEVKKNIDSEIMINSSSNDPRSYRLDSNKLLKIGFKNKKSYKDAIIELKHKNYLKKLKDNPKFHSVKWLKKLAKLKKIN